MVPWVQALGIARAWCARCDFGAAAGRRSSREGCAVVLALGRRVCAKWRLVATHQCLGCCRTAIRRNNKMPLDTHLACFRMLGHS